jgi:hypothetical protein
VSRVTEVEKRLVGELVQYGACHGETADAAVEYPYGRVAHERSD